MFRVVRIACCFALAGALALGAGAAGGCGSSAPQAKTTSAGASGTAIDLQQGQKLIVRLTSNPSTGYSWAVASPPSTVLKQVGSPAFQEDQTGTNRVLGAAGTEVWTFTAASKGQESLRMEYRRPWEKGVAPAQVVTYNVTVR